MIAPPPFSSSAPESAETAAPSPATMQLTEHLSELRGRVWVTLLCFLVCFGACYAFAEILIEFLLRPLAEVWQNPNRHLIFTALQEKFLVHISVAMYGGLFFTFPMFAWQLWRFVSPGLYRNEQRFLWPFLLLAPILFVGGGWLVYSGIMPMAFKFFLGFEQVGSASTIAVEIMPKISDYITLVLQLILAFGLVFQIPVVLLLLVKSGLMPVSYLYKGRRYAIVITFILAAVLTPPDPLSQLGMALPLLVLYEITVVIARLIAPKLMTEGAAQ